MDITPADRSLLDGIQSLPSGEGSSHHFAISLSAPLMVEIKCVTVSSLESNVDVGRNGEILAQLACWLTDLGELKASMSLDLTAFFIGL